VDRAGIEFTIVDSTEIPSLMRHTDSGEYLQAPVVHAGPDNHFSGFRPDRLKALQNSAVFAPNAIEVSV
jgi:glutaredoxin-like protein NrdH